MTSPFVVGWNKIINKRIVDTSLSLITPTTSHFPSLPLTYKGLVYDDFIRFLFLYVHRETYHLTDELSEESDQFRFLRETCLSNLMGSVGVILTKTLVMSISIPLDLSSRSFIPLSRFIRSRSFIPLSRFTPFLAPSLDLFPPRSD